MRAGLIPQGDAATALVQHLRDGITGRNPMAGSFVQPAGEGTQSPFQQRLCRYLTNRTDADFVSLSRDMTKLLSDTMKDEPLATGGYLVFAEHEHNNDWFFLIVLLSTRAEPTFDDQLNLTSAVTLDFEHLRHAARIKEAGVIPSSPGAVHFVSRRADAVSDYFLKFLGCEKVTDPAAQGANLHSALSQWASSQNLNEEQKEEVMQKTYSYWQGCRKEKKLMTLTGLANALYPNDPRTILSHLGNESHNLAGEFSPPSPAVMKKFVKFSFADDQLKLEFDRNKWMNKIKVVGQNTVKISDAPASLIDMIKAEHGTS